MAKIDALPSLDIIRGLKGILDFYVWKGLPCVRAWPRYRPAKQTPASLAAALVFGAVVKAYGLLGPLPLEAYRDDAKDQTRTARDIMVTGVYGNLHEASMSDFLTLLQESRDFLSQLTALLNALDSASLDELDVNVEASVLPTGASTAAAQALALAQLQNIGDLQDALQSKALDRLLVRGMDQLFTIQNPLGQTRTGIVSGANGYFDSWPAGAGFRNVITTICVRDATSPVTKIFIFNNFAGSNVGIHEEIRDFAAGDRCCWAGQTILGPTDFLRAFFVGALAGDAITIETSGYVMTLET